MKKKLPFDLWPLWVKWTKPKIPIWKWQIYVEISYMQNVTSEDYVIQSPHLETGQALQGQGARIILGDLPYIFGKSWNWSGSPVFWVLDPFSSVYFLLVETVLDIMKQIYLKYCKMILFSFKRMKTLENKCGYLCVLACILKVHVLHTHNATVFEVFLWTKRSSCCFDVNKFTMQAIPSDTDRGTSLYPIHHAGNTQWHWQGDFTLSYIHHASNTQWHWQGDITLSYIHHASNTQWHRQGDITLSYI